MPANRQQPPGDYVTFRDCDRIMAHHCELNAEQFQGRDRARELAAQSWKAEVIEANSKLFATQDDMRRMEIDIHLLQLWKENKAGRDAMVAVVWGVFIFAISIGVSIALKLLVK